MKKILFLGLSVLFSSCNPDKIEERVIDLLVSPESELTKISEIATDVKYIPLQTTEHGLIPYILDVKKNNEKVFVRTNRSEILCFNNAGQYLFKLSNSGRGPEEYTYIYDFDVTDDNILLVLTRSRLLFFNIADSAFIYFKTLNFKFDPGYVAISPDQNHILLSYGSSYGNEPYRNVLINMNGDTIMKIPNQYKYSKNTKMHFAATFENINFNYKNLLHFKFWLNDTVFTLTEDNKVEPYLIFDSHGKQTTIEALANFSENTLRDYTNVNSILETNRYIIYRYFSEKLCVRVFDKISSKILYIDYKSRDMTLWVTDDFTGGVNIEPKFCIDGDIYAWTDAITLKKHIASDEFKSSSVKFPDKKEALQKLADSLDETDNPVLIVVTPKN